MMARLSPLPPEELDGDVLALYRDMAAMMQQNQPGVVSQAPDGALLGPFTPMLHFPQFGRGVWEGTKLFMRSYTLPEPVRQVAILVVGSSMDARFELYSHEIVAEASGLSGAQVAALAAGQRPPDLTDDQAMALAVARVLVEGRQLPESTYRATVAALGEVGTTELVFLIGAYILLAIIINGYDLPGRDERPHDGDRAGPGTPPTSRDRPDAHVPAGTNGRPETGRAAARTRRRAPESRRPHLPSLLTNRAKHSRRDAENLRRPPRSGLDGQ